MPKKSSGKSLPAVRKGPPALLSGDRRPRVPPAIDGIQVNACRSVLCDNFGVSPLPFVTHGSVKKGAERIQDSYRISGGGRLGPGRKRLYCTKCGSHSYLKSNLAVGEELARISRHFNQAAPDPSCPNAACANHGRGVRAHPELYRLHGRTSAGSRRYRCKACGRCLAERKGWREQLRSHENRTVFELLVNKSPLKAISRITGLGQKAVYDKIDFIHRQCLAFAADRETEIGKKVKRRLYIATDRQDYIINWTDRKDKKNVQLTAIGSAENRTGYVLAMHLNFDPDLDQEETEAQSIVARDFEIQEPAFRKYARVWTMPDFLDARRNDPGPNVPPLSGEKGVWSRVDRAYQEMAAIPDPEAKERIFRHRQLPPEGMQVHYEYTVHAHYRLLRRMLAEAPRFAFFMDQDDTLRAGCLSAFAWEIKSGMADAFAVQIDKDLTVDDRRKLVKESNELFDRIRAQLNQPKWPDWKIRLFLISLELNKLPKSKWRDRWLHFPEHTMAEPDKAVAHITDRGDLGLMRRSSLYARASLHSIDRYFMQLRRLVSMLERPIASASNARRMWYGYAPYKPRIIQKLLDIHRVYYNYVKLSNRRRKRKGADLKDDEGKTTPAMRLGLAKGRVRPEDILYFGRRAKQQLNDEASARDSATP